MIASGARRGSGQRGSRRRTISIAIGSEGAPLVIRGEKIVHVAKSQPQQELFGTHLTCGILIDLSMTVEILANLVSLNMSCCHLTVENMPKARSQQGMLLERRNKYKDYCSSAT